MSSCFYTSVVQNYGQLMVRGYYNGERFSEKVKYKPYLFIKSNTDKSTYTDIKGKLKISRVDFDSIKDAKEFVDRYTGVDNFDIYGMNKFQYTYINDEYPESVPYDIKQMSIVSIDIEVASDNGFPYPESAANEVTAITLSKNGKYYVFGCGDYVSSKPNVMYAKCYSEEMLLHKFLDFWKILDPDIVTGWNVELFDIPYLYNRIKNVLSEEVANSMSPWNTVFEREINQKYGKGMVKILNGITIFDYMTLYKKFSNTPQENYRLNTVASYELKLGKIDYTGSLLDLYKTDYQKFIDYNIRDVELVVLMEEKLKFIELACAIAYDAKVNLTDALSTVNLWDVIIHNYLLKKNIVIPFQQFEGGGDDGGVSIQGGYVKEPQIGYHEWVVSWDFDSLYPHIAMMMNISPDTFEYMAEYDGAFFNVDQLLKEGLNDDIQSSIAFSDSAYAANHALFYRGKQGFFSALMESMYVDRQKYKKLMVEAKKAYEKDKSFENEKKIAQYNAFQHAKKIQLNSAYGALANKYFRWFDHRLAEAITITGQYCIRYIEKKMNAYLNDKFETVGVDYVIASDTDSVYVKFDKQERIDEEIVNKKIDEWCHEIFYNLNGHKPVLKMKRESIASNAIWTGTKHYVLNVVDSEGVKFKEPKIVMKGIEAVKSSTPTAVRSNMVDAIKIIMNGTEDDLVEFVSKAKRDFRTRPYEDISFPRSVNDLAKYYDRVTLWAKGTPIQVKGSLVYNEYIKKKKLNYPAIVDASKIKFCYLKTPNPLRSEVIATPNELPEEFGLSRYIDYDTQFSKAFLMPIKSIADQRNWELERRNTLF